MEMSPLDKCEDRSLVIFGDVILGNHDIIRDYFTRERYENIDDNTNLNHIYNEFVYNKFKDIFSKCWDKYYGFILLDLTILRCYVKFSNFVSRTMQRMFSILFVYERHQSRRLSVLDTPQERIREIARLDNCLTLYYKLLAGLEAETQSKKNCAPDVVALVRTANRRKQPCPEGLKVSCQCTLHGHRVVYWFHSMAPARYSTSALQAPIPRCQRLGHRHGPNATADIRDGPALGIRHLPSPDAPCSPTKQIPLQHVGVEYVARNSWVAMSASACDGEEEELRDEKLLFRKLKQAFPYTLIPFSLLNIRCRTIQYTVYHGQEENLAPHTSKRRIWPLIYCNRWGGQSLSAYKVKCRALLILTRECTATGWSRQRVKYPDPCEVLDSEGLLAPVVLQGIRKFEDTNGISINVYTAVDKDSNIIDESFDKQASISISVASRSDVALGASVSVALITLLHPLLRRGERLRLATRDGRRSQPGLTTATPPSPGSCYRARRPKRAYSAVISNCTHAQCTLPSPPGLALQERECNITRVRATTRTISIPEITPKGQRTVFLRTRINYFLLGITNNSHSRSSSQYRYSIVKNNWHRGALTRNLHEEICDFCAYVRQLRNRIDELMLHASQSNWKMPTITCEYCRDALCTLCHIATIEAHGMERMMKWFGRQRTSRVNSRKGARQPTGATSVSGYVGRGSQHAASTVSTSTSQIDRHGLKEYARGNSGVASSTGNERICVSVRHKRPYSDRMKTQYESKIITSHTYSHILTYPKVDVPYAANCGVKCGGECEGVRRQRRRRRRRGGGGESVTTGVIASMSNAMHLWKSSSFEEVDGIYSVGLKTAVMQIVVLSREWCRARCGVEYW
ncbi:hypothetical protein PR048_023866 [Dryococelus australis]|uniref:Uncharacterized protein n=1 Tax=Dryococelus australis TaxID=614101 RepID=A0ABQ9GVC0_9NEOP|nr:hypothetical protein PR048_023866 [Dryococelus australis]